ncbi:nuclear transport factor 2 family protein [Mammaliicoccus sciuri]|uniref:nuclear transport factor 2 family protein n=1 Tax=Mammaliicoccus sciuri TaxID=1296 RepID=UPI001F3ABDC3|nr:nuclear transport factor 2 family protein [Mammaliicoccus sciuri]MCE4979506.1 nuclear transport factor 2 family protein [Mammaliicoccus sciuri]MCE5084146.1 nuclear transport factor 2 family protein [Mammaliicoccus sciuri]MCE5093718.1 nuclear transport factor 2 family protein [Mammaliicoccus sciuri]
MNILDEYFILFDEARYSEESFHKLNELFHDDIEFVLNKKTFKGKEAWKQFVKNVYTTNKDLKHMHNGWTQNEDGSYETDWAICGNRYETGVYTQEGKDIARLDANGKIIYLENQPKDDQLFSNQS